MKILFIKENTVKAQKLIFYSFDEKFNLLNRDELDWYGTFFSEIQEICKEKKFDPDSIVFWGAEHYHIPIGIENTNSFLTLFICDWNLRFASCLKVIPLFDYVFVDKLGKSIFDSYGIINVDTFPLAPFYLENLEDYKINDYQKDIDLLFIGSIRTDIKPQRDNWLHRIAALSDKYNVLMYRNLYFEKYFEILSRSKIVFNFSIRSEINMRFYETLYVNSLAIIEDSNIEVEDIFQENKHYITYNEENFEEKINFYLNNNFEREKISNQGNKFLKKRNYNYFLSNFAKKLNKMSHLKNSRIKNKNNSNIYLFHVLHAVYGGVENREKFLIDNIVDKNSNYYNFLACLEARRLNRKGNVFFNNIVKENLYKSIELDSSNLIAYFNLFNYYLNKLDLEKLDYILNEITELINKNPYTSKSYLDNPFLFDEFSHFRQNIENAFIENDLNKASKIIMSQCLYIYSSLIRKYDLHKSLKYINLAIDTGIIFSEFFKLRGEIYEELEEFDLSINDYLFSLEKNLLDIDLWKFVISKLIKYQKLNLSIQKAVEIILFLNSLPQYRFEIESFIALFTDKECLKELYSLLIKKLPNSLSINYYYSYFLYKNGEYFESINKLNNLIKLLGENRELITKEEKNNIYLNKNNIYYLLSLNLYETGNYIGVKHFQSKINEEIYLKKIDKITNFSNLVELLEKRLLENKSSFLLLRLAREYLNIGKYDLSRNNYFEALKYSFAEENLFIQKIIFSDLLFNFDNLNIDQETLSEIIEEGKILCSDFEYYNYCLSIFYKKKNDLENYNLISKSLNKNQMENIYF